MPGAHKIGAAISGPRIAGGNFMDITLFLSNTSETKNAEKKQELIQNSFGKRPFCKTVCGNFLCFYSILKDCFEKRSGTISFFTFSFSAFWVPKHKERDSGTSDDRLLRNLSSHGGSRSKDRNSGMADDRLLRAMGSHGGSHLSAPPLQRYSCEFECEFCQTDWVLFRPTFLSVKNFCIFVLCDLVKTD